MSSTVKNNRFRGGCVSAAVCVWGGEGRGGNQISNNKSVRWYQDLLADTWVEGRRTMCPAVAGSALVTPAACPVPFPKNWPPPGWEPQLPAIPLPGQPGFGPCMVHPAIERRCCKGEAIVYIYKYIYRDIKCCSSPLSTQQMAISAALNH